MTHPDSTDPINEGDAATRSSVPVYSPMARLFHWVTVALVFGLVPVGYLMTYRGKTLDIWDATTNGMYSAHKLAGFTLLIVIVLRVIHRIGRGAPPDEPTLAPWQRIASHAVHGLMYVFLLIVPMLGWIGVSLFPALEVFGLFSLPALAEPNKAGAEVALWWHGLAAWTLVALVSLHIAAALQHYFIRKDGVMHRMWPGLRQKR